MTSESVSTRLLAPAKLTLNLRITGVRADGYHLIDAEMVTLDLCDELVVRQFDDHGGAASVSIVPADWSIPTDRSNLVLRALELAGRTAGVEIRKRIPPGAGLGGGSADAAAILRWANRLSAHGQPAAAADSPLVTASDAAALGADVAFCLVGGRCRVSGIGEQITPLAHRAQSFLLLTPTFSVSTERVYRTWDELGGPTAANSNDLETAALAAYPELAQWRDALGNATGRTPQLAGSGGTWFVPAPHGHDEVHHHGVSAIRAHAIGRL